MAWLTAIEGVGILIPELRHMLLFVVLLVVIKLET